MNETSLSLLDSLRDPNNAAAWQRVVELYEPLIRGWLRRQHLGEQDQDDVIQEVLTVLARKIQGFEHQGQQGSFRSWLRKTTLYQLRDFRRNKRFRNGGNGGTQFAEMLEQLADPDSGLSRLWNEEHDRHVFQYLCRRARSSFTDQTWTAFQRTALRGEDAEAVASDLGISTNAVYVARSRVLGHLRRLGAGLLD
jgi:RNA polymerase sigma-70 factor (ECF subfamily)